jgi:predicted permease
MRIDVWRSIIAAAATELAIYFAWIALVLLAGLFRADPTRAQWFAHLFAPSMGILLGFILCIFAGAWVARVSEDAIKNGLVVGAMCAALNALIIAAMSREFPPVLLIGSLGRVLGGSIGGWLVQRRRTPNNPLHATREDARA